MKLIGYITSEKQDFEKIYQDLRFLSNSLNIIDLFCRDEDGNAIDISNSTITFIVKENSTDEDSSAILNKDIIDFTSPLTGNTLIEITKADCQSIVGNYIYELRIALPESGHEYILKQGSVCFSRSIYGIS
jgi:hypothetical protein